MKPRDKKTDPQPGDKVEHVDGGTMYVMRRTALMVAVKLPPHWRDKSAWMRLSTFTKVAR